MVKIEIFSEEIIKPSSSDNLKLYKLSLLDQLAPFFYVPVVLFYSAPDDQIDILKKLKKSLSETLAKFYPLAGRIHDDSYVEVFENDGVLLVEARVNVQLSEILETPEIDLVQKLLPLDSYGRKTGGNEGVRAMAVQLNVFECGGIAIGICISHKIADGTTLSSFLKAWAEITTSFSGGDCIDDHDGVKDITDPFLDSASVFPPREIHVQSPRNMIKRGKIVTRRFVFNKSSLEKLKVKAATDDCSPTRVEAVTALICRTAMNSSKGRSAEKGSRPSPSMVISHVVNLRSRMDPPLPENSLGNIWRCAETQIVEEESTKLEMHDLVVQMRKAIRKMDKDYVERLRSEDGFVQAFKSLKEASVLVSEGVVPFYKFSSWVRFPIYETDFGWGIPIWACITSVPIKDVVILMSNRFGDGIEAWVNLEVDDMTRFERDEELIEFASQASC